ncbi:MAG: AtpZ/AtpI family protein [Anaerolineae bacterium]|jgi:ATP synthase protein I
MSDKRDNWSDIAWVLAIGAQGGLMVALPAVAGLALGFWLDNQFGTLPWLTLIFTLIGAMSGPVVLYRWVTSVVRERMKSRLGKKVEDEEEESS